MTLTLWSFGVPSLIQECFRLRLNVLYVVPERAESSRSWTTYRQLICNFPPLALASVPDRFVLLVWEGRSVLCCGPVGAPRKLELRTRNETSVQIFMHV